MKKGDNLTELWKENDKLSATRVAWVGDDSRKREKKSFRVFCWAERFDEFLFVWKPQKVEIRRSKLVAQSFMLLENFMGESFRIVFRSSGIRCVMWLTHQWISAPRVLTCLPASRDLKGDGVWGEFMNLNKRRHIQKVFENWEFRAARSKNFLGINLSCRWGGEVNLIIYLYTYWLKNFLIIFGCGSQWVYPKISIAFIIIGSGA